jgi:hypothetical protein
MPHWRQTCHCSVQSSCFLIHRDPSRRMHLHKTLMWGRTVEATPRMSAPFSELLFLSSQHMVSRPGCNRDLCRFFIHLGGGEVCAHWRSAFMRVTLLIRMNEMAETGTTEKSTPHSIVAFATSSIPFEHIIC